MTPPEPQAVARRLLILRTVNAHAMRLMMVWDFGFRTADAFREILGVKPAGRFLGVSGLILKCRARWNWYWERRVLRGALKARGVLAHLTTEEREFIGLGLSEAARQTANKFVWQIEACACLAWALHLTPRLWPMDEQFNGELNIETFWDPDSNVVESARLRAAEEIDAARERIKLWHWRARQLVLERGDSIWPPTNATPEEIADLKRQGFDTLDGIVRVTARRMREKGQLSEIIDEDFVAKGKAYRELDVGEAEELLVLAELRHRALNWLCGLAENNDWSVTPIET